ncbi:hypothetical protein [Azotobacter armeniacus]
MKDFRKALFFSLSLTALSVAAIPAQANSDRSLVPTEPRSETSSALATQVQQPQVSNVFASANNPSEGLQRNMTVASLATSCADPQPWYMFSGIEALTCLFSGQWSYQQR